MTQTHVTHRPATTPRPGHRDQRRPSDAHGDPTPLRAVLAPDEVSIGIDIGGTKTLATAYGTEGALASVRRDTVRSIDGLLAGVDAVVARLRTHPALGDRHIGSLGIGLPGLVDPAAGTVSHGVNIGLPREDVAFAALVADRTGIPTLIGNDVNAAAVGAAHALGSEDAALVWIGTGLAGGFIFDGNPRHGSGFGVGEFGHLVYRQDGLECSCGQRGCLEMYASGAALSRAALAVHPDREPADVWDDAAAGDPGARAALADWLAAVAWGIHVIGLTVDPKTIILGGGVASVGAPLLDGLRSALRAAAEPAPFLGRLALADRLTLMPEGVDAPTLGAAIMAAKGLPA